MTKTKTLVALVAVASLALASCSSDDDSSSDGDQKTDGTTAQVETSGTSVDAPTGGEVYEISGDTTIDVEAGSTFTLALEANATTGYQWSQEVDGAAVKKTGDAYLAPGDPGVVGQGGTQEYTYEAVAAGTATISLTYAQVGSGDVGQQYTVTVEVS